MTGEPLLRDAVRMIQDIVIQSKGSPLDREAIRRLEAVLGRLAAPEAAPLPHSGYSERDATILFADLRGFSAIASAYPADVVLGVLSRCFGLLSEVIVRHYGTIDKFMGDAVMAVFHGGPSPRDHAQRALLCAVEMQIAMDELHRRHRDDRLPEIYIGIGISSGNVMAGLIGSDAYRAYTVIGEEVNLAARIEAFSLRGQVLISEATYAHCRDFVHASEPMEVHVKGKAEPLGIREVLGIPALGRTVPRQDLRKSPRVPVDLVLEYQGLSGKVVDRAPMHGRVRDISYHGALVEVAAPLPAYAELRLAFDLPCVGFRAAEIYARAVSVRSRDRIHFAGLEFTSLGAETGGKIRHFVQLCIQGACPEAGAPVTR
jgi:adenylate cyclase